MSAVPSSRRFVLEPMSRVTIWITLVHVVLGLLLWWLADSNGLFQGGSGQDLHWTSPAELLGEEGFQTSIQIKSSPASKSATAEPVVAKPARMKALAVTPEMLAQLSKAASATPAAKPAATPLLPVPIQPPTAAAEPISPPLEDPPANVQRTITVSQPQRSAKNSVGLLDLPQMDSAGEVDGVKMDSVDRAIIQAFKACWKPPAGEDLDSNNSSVIMDIAVNRAGRVLSFKIVLPSGHTALDDSVLQAANQLQNIGTELPRAFGKDRYEPRLNFYAE